MSYSVSKPGRQFWMILVAGAVMCRISTGGAAPASGSTTNTIQWLSLTDVLKRWNDTPLSDVESAANRGDVTAQHYLGYCYGDGIRVRVDGPKAVEWYQRAGSNGYLPSLSNLGLLYQRGNVVPQDFGKMFYYYRLAADAGLPRAQLNLGVVYRDGIGVRPDFTEAMAWFQRAAAQSNGVAMAMIGRFYRFGQGVPKDLAKAGDWFEKAAGMGDALGKLNLGLLYDEEEGQPQKALTLYQQLADDGEAEAMVRLYFCYWEGRGVPIDHAAAMKWLRRAAEKDNPYAECLLGYRNEHPEWEGTGPNRRLPDPNWPEAVRWYRRSAENNWAGGQYHLGLLYLEGKGLEQDEAQGVDLMRQAADQDHSDALYKLAWLYARDIGEPRNENDRPFKLLLRAAAGGSRESFWALSQRYQEGLGTPRDLVEAAAWRFRGAQAGLEWGRNDALIAHAFDRIKPRDPYSAVLFTFGAAAEGDMEAIRQLGKMYSEGKDVPADPAKATFWSALAGRPQKPVGDFPATWFDEWNQAARAAREVIADLQRR